MNGLLEQILPANIFALALVFCRVGAAIALMPGFGDAYVPARVRLVLALAVTVVVTPIVAAGLPAQPASDIQLTLYMFDEVFVGSFIGLVGRVLLASLETAGAIIATQSSLSSAITFNPGATSPETLPASMFGALAVVLIFATNMHHMLLRAVIESYQTFPAASVPPFEDMSRTMVLLTARGFDISVRLAAPYIVLGTLFYLTLGLIGRIMPQLQIFFIGLPLQLLGGLAMLLLMVSGSMLWFLGVFQEVMMGITQLH